MPTFRAEEPGINWAPIVLTLVFVGIFIAAAIPSSWVGQLLTRGPQQEDPIDRLNYLEARQIIEAEIAKALEQVGAQGKFSWTAAGDQSEPVDMTANQPVQLTVETSLSSPDLRRGIIDPVKPYMEKAQVLTLTMNDARSRATWTYTVNPPMTQPPPDAGLE